MPVRGFRLIACVVVAATLGASEAPAASGHQDRRACAEVDTNLSPARKQEYAGLVAAAVGKRVRPTQVKIFNVLTSDAWSAVYAGTPVADDGFLFFQEINGKKQYKDAWGGMAQPSERPDLIAWAKKIGAPESLAACFADVAIGK